jgi:hypothetical protein
MRATQDPIHTARRVLGALAVVVATTLMFVAPANAAGGGAPKTPLGAYKRFAFEFEVAVTTSNSESALTVSTKGVYVGPRSQDCKATVSLGAGFRVTQRAVIIGDAIWVGKGNGDLKRKSGRHAFEFEDQCASSPGFWDEFSFGPGIGLQGTTETRGGIAVEHIDFTEVFGTLSGLVEDLPPDVTAERASVWRSKHDNVIVGLDIALRADSSDSCRDMLDLDATDAAPPTCSMTIRLDLSRFDDPKLDVHAGQTAKGRVIRT